MSQANAPETDPDEDASSLPPLPAGVRNYLTPAGYARLKSERTLYLLLFIIVIIYP